MTCGGFTTAVRLHPARAKWGVLFKRLPGDRFKAFRARRPELEGLDVAPCLNALVMGDSVSVEIANAAREGVLRSFGLFVPA
eukprot:6508709-Pyramimonas_sp.AAC.1